MNWELYPKSLQQLPDRFKDAVMAISDERDNDDGWWIYLKEPYFNPQLECRTIHEHRLTDAIRILKSCVNYPIDRKI